MENEITVRIVEGDESYFIARAVGYPGVSSFGKSQEQAIERIEDAWMAMNRFEAIKNMPGGRRPVDNSHATETNLRLQFA